MSDHELELLALDHMIEAGLPFDEAMLAIDDWHDRDYN